LPLLYIGETNKSRNV